MGKGSGKAAESAAYGILGVLNLLSARCASQFSRKAGRAYVIAINGGNELFHTLREWRGMGGDVHVFM